MEDAKRPAPSSDIYVSVMNSFLIYSPRDFLQPLTHSALPPDKFSSHIELAASGLNSVISAASLPFILTQNGVAERRFDKFLAAARIRSMIPKIGTPEAGSPDEDAAYKKACDEMDEFSRSNEGASFFRDEIVYQLHRSLKSDEIRTAAQELLIQTLIGTWSIFESFARGFIIDWINARPTCAQLVMKLPDLKDYFGKQSVDIQTIGDHDWDLSRSMGSVIFKGRRLDSLSVIRSLLKALFRSSELKATLGDDLWLLNQKRHLFVHHRGLVDQEFKKWTGDNTPIGERLTISGEDVEKYLITVRSAILEVIAQARASG